MRKLRDAVGKQRTNNRTRDLMIRSGEECKGAVAVAYPDLGGIHSIDPLNFAVP
jgi:hypothetical protein